MHRRQVEVKAALGSIGERDILDAEIVDERPPDDSDGGTFRRMALAAADLPPDDEPVPALSTSCSSCAGRRGRPGRRARGPDDWYPTLRDLAADHTPSHKWAMRLMAVMLGRNTYAAALVVTKFESPVTSIGGLPSA